MHQLINDLFRRNVFCRTATALPGLLHKRIQVDTKMAYLSVRMSDKQFQTFYTPKANFQCFCQSQIQTFVFTIQGIPVGNNPSGSLTILYYCFHCKTGDYTFFYDCLTVTSYIAYHSLIYIFLQTQTGAALESLLSFNN